MIAGIDRIASIFDRPRTQQRAALILYLMAGDPDLQTSALIIDAVTAAGADLIELGIPYGDPLADGPTIAAAGQRALSAGATLDATLALATAAAQRHCAPVIFFSYINPIAQYGSERFASAAGAAGALGAIVPDVPLEELDAFAPAFHVRGLGIPLLVAPTTPPARAASIAAQTDGFTYVVSRLGVTGTRREPDIAWIAGAVERLRAYSPKPVAVGFGISTPEHVRRIAAIADGVIVGSALIDAVGDRRGPAAADAAFNYVSALRAAV